MQMTYAFCIDHTNNHMHCGFGLPALESALLYAKYGLLPSIQNYLCFVDDGYAQRGEFSVLALKMIRC
jgi:hypothetical protein